MSWGLGCRIARGSHLPVHSTELHWIPLVSPLYPRPQFPESGASLSPRLCPKPPGLGAAVWGWERNRAKFVRALFHQVLLISLQLVSASSGLTRMPILSPPGSCRINLQASLGTPHHSPHHRASFPKLAHIFCLVPPASLLSLSLHLCIVFLFFYSLPNFREIFGIRIFKCMCSIWQSHKLPVL